MAHVFDTNLRFSGPSNPLTSDYTLGSGATLLVLGIVTAGPVKRNGGAPTFNGVALTQADETRQYAIDPETSCELWYIAGADTGSALEISIPNPNSLVLHIQASSYAAASGFVSELYDEDGDSGITASPNILLLPSEPGNVTVSVFGDGEDFIPGGFFGVELNRSDNGLYSDNNSFDINSSGLGWATQAYGDGVYGGGIYNGDDDWCMCIAAFKEATVSVTVEPTVQTLSLSLLAPSISTGTSTSISVSALNLNATLVAPSVTVDVTCEITVETLALVSPAPASTSDVIITPSALVLISDLVPNSLLIEFDITVGVPVLNLGLTVEQHNTLAPLPVVRMIPFIFSTDIAYPMEFGDKYVRFYFDGEPLLDGGTHIEITTPYSSDELYQLQTEQSADVMWITHPNHPQAKLSRTSPTTFTLEEIVFEKGPFIKRNDFANDDGVTMNVDATGAGEPGILKSSSNIFKKAHVGALFELTHPRVNRQTNGSLTGTQIGLIGEAIEVLGDFTYSVTSETWEGTVKLQRSTDDFATFTVVKIFESGPQSFSDTEIVENVQYRIKVTAHTSGKIAASLLVNTNAVEGSAEAVGIIKTPLDIKGSFNFNTQGNWGATIVLERNEDESGWEPFRTYTSKLVNDVGSRNVQFSGIENEDNVRYRMNVTAYTDGEVFADLAATSSTKSGIVRITNKLAGNKADIIVVSSISQTTDTKRWAEGSWSGVRGYPSAITFIEERAVYGFTDSDQQTIWLSATDEFEDFDAGTIDSDSFAVRLRTADRGRWLGSLDVLAAGTAGSEWYIRAPLNEAITPDNFTLKEQTAYGSTDVKAIKVGSVLLFIDSIGRKIREFTFREADNKYVAPDLTALAEHITVSGIVNVAHQKNPDSVVWGVLDNGDLITMSYEREQNVIAWAKMPMDGLVQSVMVIPAASEDEVWVSVVRAVNGDNKVYIEQLQPRILDIRKENAFFVDSGIIYKNQATDTIIGLSHLEGKIVKILADGVVLDDQRVTGGQVVLDSPASNVRVGLGYKSKLTPMRMDVNTGAGTTHGSIKKISEIVVSFMDTNGAKYGKDDTSLFGIDFDRVGLKNTSKIEGLFTGDVTVPFDGGFDIDDSMVIEQDDPLPCVVRAIVPRVDKTGR